MSLLAKTDCSTGQASNSPPAMPRRLPKSLILASYATFLCAVALVVISRRTDSHAPLIQAAALLLLITGLLCGILAIFGSGRGSGQRMLWRAIMGTLANVVLLSAILPAFSNEIRQGFGPKLHLGTWDTQTPEGVRQTWTFTSTRFTLTMGGVTGSGAYVIDYSKNPIWLTVMGEQGRTEMVLEFKGTNRMRVLGSRGQRPSNIEQDPDRVLVLEKRP